MPKITPITRSDVAIVDKTTGGVSRPWYMFFQSLYETLTTYITSAGNALFSGLRVNSDTLGIEPGTTLLYSPNVSKLIAAGQDVSTYGELQFLMSNSDGSSVKYAGFDPVANFTIPGQIACGFLPNGLNTADQQLNFYSVVSNTISANITLTTATLITPGTRASIIIVTLGSTSRTVTFGTGFKTTGTLATGTTSGKYFVISFVSDGNYMIESSRTTAM